MPELKSYRQEAATDTQAGDVQDPTDAIGNPSIDGNDVIDPKPPARKAPSQDLPNENPPAPTSDDIRDREPPERTLR